MLKITTQENTTGTIFELEGKLAGPWVPELESCWRRAVATDQPVRVLLKAVTFIDDVGKGLLAEMHRNGAELGGEGCMTKAIVAEIQGENHHKNSSKLPDMRYARGEINNEEFDAKKRDLS